MATQSFDIGKGIFWFFIRFGERPAGALWLMLFQTLCVLALMGVGVVVMGPAYLNLFELIGADATGHLADAEAARLVLRLQEPLKLPKTISGALDTGFLLCRREGPGLWGSQVLAQGSEEMPNRGFACKLPEGRPGQVREEPDAVFR